MGQVRQVQKWLAQKKKSADFKSSDLGSSAYTLINYPQNLTQIIFYIFFLQPRLIFIGIKVMRPSRKEISSMLFIFTPKELKWIVMRKNWRPNCTTTGLLHILNLVRWWELLYPFFSLLKLLGCQWWFSKKDDNFECMPKKKFSGKVYMPYLGLSKMHRSNVPLTPDINEHHKLFLKLR